MTLQEKQEPTCEKILQKTSNRQWVRGGIITIIFMLLLGWVYSPVLTSNYGFNDDYALLKRVAEGADFRTSDSISTGRPLSGLGNLLLFRIPHSISTLKNGRYVSVAGIVVFALVAFGVFRKAGFDELFSATGALLMSLTPSFAIFAGWLTTGLDTYAAAMALFGGYLLARAVEEPARRVVDSIIGILLLFAVYACYQPLAAFGVIPLLIRAWRGFQVDWQKLRAFAWGIGLFLAASALYFITYKLFVVIFQPGGQTERARLVVDLVGRLRFFVTQLLWSALTGWFRLHPMMTQCVSGFLVGGVIVAGCLAKPRKSLTLQLAGLACVVAALVLTTLTVLVIREELFAYRTLGALLATTALAFLIGWERLVRSVALPFAKAWRTAGLAGIICLAALLTHHHVYQDFVAIHSADIARLTQGIKAINKFPDALVYITPVQGTQPSDNVAEFDYSSAALPWAVQAMLELLFIEQFENDIPLRRALRHHKTFQVRYGPPNPDALPVLDGFTLINGESQPMHDPYWGDIRTNLNGWCCSDWFGVFDNRSFPAIYHSQLGWLKCSGKGTDDYWFWSAQYGWFWTAPKSFPSVMFQARNSWFFLAPTITPTCSFYDLERKEWTTTPEAKVSTSVAAKQ